MKLRMNQNFSVDELFSKEQPLNDKFSEKIKQNLIRHISKEEFADNDIFTPNFIEALENIGSYDKVSFKNDLISVEHSDQNIQSTESLKQCHKIFNSNIYKNIPSNFKGQNRSQSPKVSYIHAQKLRLKKLRKYLNQENSQLSISSGSKKGVVVHSNFQVFGKKVNFSPSLQNQFSDKKLQNQFSDKKLQNQQSSKKIVTKEDSILIVQKGEWSPESTVRNDLATFEELHGATQTLLQSETFQNTLENKNFKLKKLQNNQKSKPKIDSIDSSLMSQQKTDRNLIQQRKKNKKLKDQQISYSIVRNFIPTNGKSFEDYDRSETIKELIKNESFINKKEFSVYKKELDFRKEVDVNQKVKKRINEILLQEKRNKDQSQNCKYFFKNVDEMSFKEFQESFGLVGNFPIKSQQSQYDNQQNLSEQFNIINETFEDSIIQKQFSSQSLSMVMDTNMISEQSIIDIKSISALKDQEQNQANYRILSKQVTSARNSENKSFQEQSSKILETQQTTQPRPQNILNEPSNPITPKKSDKIIKEQSPQQTLENQQETRKNPQKQDSGQIIMTEIWKKESGQTSDSFPATLSGSYHIESQKQSFDLNEITRNHQIIKQQAAHFQQKEDYQIQSFLNEQSGFQEQVQVLKEQQMRSLERTIQQTSRFILEKKDQKNQMIETEETSFKNMRSQETQINDLRQFSNLTPNLHKSFEIMTHRSDLEDYDIDPSSYARILTPQSSHIKLISEQDWQSKFKIRHIDTGLGTKVQVRKKEFLPQEKISKQQEQVVFVQKDEKDRENQFSKNLKKYFDVQLTHLQKLKQINNNLIKSKIKQPQISQNEDYYKPKKLRIIGNNNNLVFETQNLAQLIADAGPQVPKKLYKPSQIRGSSLLKQIKKQEQQSISQKNAAYFGSYKSSWITQNYANIQSPTRLKLKEIIDQDLPQISFEKKGKEGSPESLYEQSPNQSAKENSIFEEIRSIHESMYKNKIPKDQNSTNNRINNNNISAITKQKFNLEDILQNEARINQWSPMRESQFEQINDISSEFKNSIKQA